jgi:hypothetical protein
MPRLITPVLGIPLPERRPETYLPTDHDLISIIRCRPGLSLRELCLELWPGLSWKPTAVNGPSASEMLRVLPVDGGNVCVTPAQWLRERLQDLVVQGRLRLGPRRRDESDLEAALSYVIPRALSGTFSGI